MKAPPQPVADEPPPPPLLVPAVRELGRFGRIWVGAGAALLAFDLAAGSAGRLDAGELVLVLVLLGLSLGGVLGGLLLARRTGPEVLYFRILDFAPPPPERVPREPPAATTRRVLAPALALVLAFLLAAAIGVAVMLVVGGQPRDEVGADIPGGALIVAAGWTLACGAAGLRMAAYFEHWERMRQAVVWCRPLTAGTMRPVYWAERRGG